MRWFTRRSTRGGRHARASSTHVRTVAHAAPAPTQALGSREPLPPDRQLPGIDGVVLGFSDGSELRLPPADPRVSAFRAVATTLAQGRR
jgi:hypothetical protein